MHDADLGSVGSGLRDLVVLVDCRWIGASGIGRSTELLLRALSADPPPGEWVLWANQELGELAWPGVRVFIDGRHPGAWWGQRAVLGRPHHGVALYPAQIRPAGWKPSVQFLYDATPIAFDRRSASRLAKTLYYRSLGRATGLLICSDHAADDLVRRVRIDRGKLTTYGFPVDEASAARVGVLREQLGTCAEVLFIGRVAPHKNLARLVAAHARSRWSKVGSLVLVGPGTEVFDDPTAAVLGLGRIPSAELEMRLAVARAVILPSLSEGFGLPVLEAQAAGLAVLASDISPLRELLDPRLDIAFDPYDIVSIARALDAVAGGRLHEPGPRAHGGTTLADHRALVLGAVAEAVARRSASRRRTW